MRRVAASRIVVIWAITAGGTLLGCSAGMNATGVESGSDGRPEPTSTYIAAKPPPGWPTPHRFQSEAEAIARAKALLSGAQVTWLDSYATWTTVAAWESLKVSHWGTLNYPAEEAEYYESGIWVVGLRADGVVSNSVLDDPAGTAAGRYADRGGYPLGTGAGRSADMGGYEVFMTFDKLGNDLETGLRDAPNAEGTPATPLPARGWELEAIGDLPAGP